MSPPKPTVLVVEDNEELAENMAELLEELAAEVRITHDGDSAIAAADASIDLAVIDVRLPGGQSGIRLVPRLRAKAPAAEIILVTGNATIDTAVAAVRQGVFAYVVKPFDPVDLGTLAERALEQVALRKEKQLLSVELEASEALYRGVVDTVEALIIGVDSEGRVALCNRFAQELAGYSIDEAQGHRFADLCIDEGDRERAEEAIDAAHGGDTVRNIALNLQLRNGQVRIVRWTIAPLLPRKARGTAILAVGIDVTETLELQRRTVESEAMAAMGALTTGLAHEIRNPLNAAALQLESLLRSGRKMEPGPVRDRLEEKITLVKSELRRLSDLLDEFLSLARPRTLCAEEVALDELVEEVLALESPLADERGIRLTAETTCEGCVVSGDRDKLKQVLINLIGNAFDAMAASSTEGAVHISTHRRTDGVVEMWVVDEGPGLDDAMVDSIFKPFVTTKAAGTGLGLTIVKKLIELHGGDVYLEPRPDRRGAVARVVLPPFTPPRPTAPTP